MSQFIYFTPEEKARAQNTDLVSLLRTQGERPVRSGREFRPPNDPSVTVRGNKWFDHSARVGGYAVSFVQRYYRKIRTAMPLQSMPRPVPMPTHLPALTAPATCSLRPSSWTKAWMCCWAW